jgi:DNA polymerase-2
VARLRASGGADDLVAPNGARFSRERGVLPEIVDGWTALRSGAIESGDAPRAYVLKILQNSFYGVLGTPSCAWAHDELAGAITGYGHEILKATRDWFRSQGREVLYGDTDSVFVLFGSEAARDPEALRALAGGLAHGAVEHLARLVRERWGVESRLDLRFDKLYARFLIPRIRGDRSARVREELERAGSLDLLDDAPGPRGRAKGYAGLLVAPDGSTRVDVKGLEAARGDWTPLARRFQVELLALAFSDAAEGAARDYANALAAELRSGRLDGELAFRRVLRRDLERYAADSPHVKAARLSGASSRGDKVEYLQTLAGPEPVGALSAAVDHPWYLERQLAPLWESIAEAAGWEPDLLRVAGPQGELF